MESICQHIEYLLTRHECVIMPGIGAFIATDVDSTVDLERGIITPRRREITFNGSIVNDDKLLCHSLARRERISYEEAHRRLTSISEKIRSDLKQEGEVTLSMIGRLLMDSEGYISFQPRSSRMRADIQPVISIIPAGASEPDAAISGTHLNRQSATDNRKLTTDNRQLTTDNQNYYVFRIHKQVAHAAAMLVFVITIGLAMLIPINHDDEQKASVLPIPSLVIPVESNDTVADTCEDVEIPEMPELP